MTQTPVHIVAIGLRSPIGLSPDAAAAAYRAGFSRLSDHPFMVDGLGEPVRGCLDPHLDARIVGHERLSALLDFVLRYALIQLAPGHPLPPLLLALPEHRPGFAQADEDAIQTRLSSSLPGLRCGVFGRGHAGSLEAIRVACQEQLGPSCGVCLVAGVESYFEADTIEWLADNRQLLDEETRGGFFPGEGAGCLVLATEAARRRAQLPSLGVIRGAGSALESALIRTDAINRASGLITAIDHAYHGFRLPSDAVDCVYSDVNGEAYRQDEWGLAQLRRPISFKYPVGRPAHCEFPVKAWGDQGAAAGVLLAALACADWRHGWAFGRRAMLVASSEGGLRSAVIIDQPTT
ncbi:MAG: hypothetical protein CSA65_01885 [Proteobacteria bacterium]|nr:MAG: hypothetical protein CSA65_01885 [Pseudomonadota bacterium]